MKKDRERDLFSYDKFFWHTYCMKIFWRTISVMTNFFGTLVARNFEKTIQVMTTKFGMVLAREKGLAPDGRKSTGE